MTHTPTEEEKKIIEEFSKLWDEGFVSYTYPQHKKDLEAFILDVVRRCKESNESNLREIENGISVMISEYPELKVAIGSLLYKHSLLRGETK